MAGTAEQVQYLGEGNQVGDERNVDHDVEHEEDASEGDGGKKCEDHRRTKYDEYVLPAATGVNPAVA
jgi:hypothetical protein